MAQADRLAAASLGRRHPDWRFGVCEVDGLPMVLLAPGQRVHPMCAVAASPPIVGRSSPPNSHRAAAPRRAAGTSGG